MGGRGPKSGMSRSSSNSNGTTAGTNPGLRFANGTSIKGFPAVTDKQDILNSIDSLQYEKTEYSYGTMYEIGVEVANTNGNRTTSFYDSAHVFVSKSSGEVSLDYTSPKLGGTGLSSTFKTLDGALKAGKKRLKASVGAHYRADGHHYY